MLRNGTMVTCTGLVTRSDLNGQRGTILEFDQGRERYSVSLAGTGEKARFKRDNLVEVATDEEMLDDTSNTDSDDDEALLDELMRSRVFREMDTEDREELFDIKKRERAAYRRT
jgi:hypothetical protein